MKGNHVATQVISHSPVQACVTNSEQGKEDQLAWMFPPQSQ